MATLDFNKAAADAWQAKAENLNQRTDLCLKAAGDALNTLKAESVGELVDEIGLTGAQLLENAAKMVNNLRGIVDAVKNIGSRLLSWVAEQAGVVSGARSKSTNL